MLCRDCDLCCQLSMFNRSPRTFISEAENISLIPGISPWILSKTWPPSPSFQIHSLWRYKELQCATTQIRNQEVLSLWLRETTSPHTLSRGQRKLAGCSQATAATFIAQERDTVVSSPPESFISEQLHHKRLLFLIFSG